MAWRFKGGSLPSLTGFLIAWVKVCQITTRLASLRLQKVVSHVTYPVQGSCVREACINVGCIFPSDSCTKNSPCLLYLRWRANPLTFILEGILQLKMGLHYFHDCQIGKLFLSEYIYIYILLLPVYSPRPPFSRFSGTALAI